MLLIIKAQKLSKLGPGRRYKSITKLAVIKLKTPICQHGT